MKEKQNKKIKTVLRWVLRIFTVLICLAVIISISLWLYLRSTLPKKNGELEISNISKPVHIIRDAYGTPHISAEDDGDLYFAAGLVHAQDRLFQMDTARRYACGRLAELTGRKSVTTDRKMRNLRLAAVAHEEWNMASDTVKHLLQRYTDGVNYIIENGPTALEYKILGCKPEPWKPEDCILVWLAFGWDLSGTGGELANGVVYQRLGRDWAGFLRDNRLADGAVIDPEAAAAVSSATDIFDTQAGSIADVKALDWAVNKRWDSPNEALPTGSGWVVSGKTTKSGKPIVVSDFCMDAAMPTEFYTMHITSTGIDFTGAFLPGVPFPLMGYNGKMAWGMTPLGADAVDFREMEWADKKNLKLADGDGVDAHSKSSKEQIDIKDDSPKDKIIISTDFGDCINGDQKAVPPMTVLWTGSKGSQSLDALYNIGKSGNRTEFLSAAEGLALPHFNIVYADEEGNIGYCMSGRLPKRGNYSGALPLKAEKITNWNGFIDEKSKPSFLNPAQGYIVAAGNRVEAGNFSENVTSDNDMPFKAERIGHLIKSGKAFTADSMKEILNDTYSLEAETILSLFRDTKLDNPWLNELLTKLKKWDRRFEGSPEPALYLALCEQLSWFVLSDDIREIAPGMTSFSADRIAPLLRALKLRKFAHNYPPLEDRNWIDDRKSGGVEDINTTLKYSLGETSNYLKKYFTDRWEKKQWGDFHSVDFIHPLWRQSLAERLFCRNMVGIDGGQDTVFNTMWWRNQPFRAQRIPVFRMIIDLADPDNSLTVKSTGQSAHPFSGGFTDEMNLLREGKYKKLLYSKRLIEEEREDELVLTPSKE